MPTTSLSRKTLVLLKSETTYGVDPVPTEAANAMLVTGDGAGVYTQETTVVDTPILRASLSPQKPLVGRTKAKASLQTYLMTSFKGGVTVGAKPWFDEALLACGFEVTTGFIAASSSSAIYTPALSPTSATVYVYADGILHKIKGCLGSVKLDLTAGAAPTLGFDFEGIYTAPTFNTFAGAATFPTDNKRLVELEGLTIGGYTPVLHSLAINFTNTIGEQTDANASFGFSRVHMTGRSASTLDITISVDSAASGFDPFAKLYDGSVNTISFTHKTSATEFITITMVDPRLVSASYADANGIRTWALQYKLHAAQDSTATLRGDELTIMFKRAI